MESNELRKVCAKEAMKYVHEGDIIGLGAGRNIEYLIEYLSEEVKSGLKIKVVTPSYRTKELCMKKGIVVLETYFVNEVDIAFDGCGEVDKNFHASKSGGGIHTKEKLIAAMAKEYILLIDEGKFLDKLDCKYPVSLEIIKDSFGYVKKCLEKMGGISTIRRSQSKDGYTITDDSNFLIDVQFDSIQDWMELNKTLNGITGVIETSLFTKEVTKIIIAGENGVRTVTRA